MTTLVFAVAACGSAKDANKGNFEKAIQAYLDTQHGLCAAIPAKELPFTLENDGGFMPDNKKRADALTAVGLLSKQDTEVKTLFGNKMAPATQYQITDAGKKYLVEHGADTISHQGAFCTGKYKVVGVDTFTEPSDMMGVKLSQVNYRYTLNDGADWSKSEAIRAVYRNFAEQSQGEVAGKAAVILTNEGWMHERLFKH